MPKRPPTPETEDGIKVLAVHFPYPPQANLQFETEQADFVSWIGACLGSPDFLIAIGFKPKTPNLVLIEISIKFQDWRRILGEHKWRKVFRHLAAGDEDRSSQIFYASHRNHREAEKNGWKFLFLVDSFIKDNYLASICHKPYPPSTWCPVPSLDQTVYTLCRHIPKNLFPDSAPRRMIPPVVGSEAWVLKSTPDALPPPGQASTISSAPSPRAATSGSPEELPDRPSLTHSVDASNAVTPSSPVPGAFPRLQSQPQSRTQSQAPSRQSAPASSPNTQWDGSTVTFESDMDRSLSTPALSEDGLGSNVDETVLSSVTDSLAETKLFDKSLQQSTGGEDSLLPTTVDTSPLIADDDDENVWATDVTARSNKDTILDLARCPVHRRLCNPNVCNTIKQHVKSLGLDIRDLRAGGPSNIKTLEREKRLQRDGSAEHESGTFGSGRGSGPGGRGFGRGNGRGRHPTRW